MGTRRAATVKSSPDLTTSSSPTDAPKPLLTPSMTTADTSPRSNTPVKPNTPSTNPPTKPLLTPHPPTKLLPTPPQLTPLPLTQLPLRLTPPPPNTKYFLDV